MKCPLLHLAKAVLRGQALGYDFVVLSASDVKDSYRHFCMANYPDRFVHFFGSIEAQCREDVPCLLCEGTQSAVLGPCRVNNDLAAGQEVEFLFSGSPCNPFSCQRTKRFSLEVVEGHERFSVTMRSVLELYVRNQPRVGIFEQVIGFTQPFVSGGVETPKDRPGFGCGMLIHA